MRIRAVSWNVHSWVGSDGQYDVDRIGDVLASLKADIVGLQEVDWRGPKHKGTDPFDHLANRLNMNPVAGPNVHDHRGDYGNGLLTRYDVKSVEFLSLKYGMREPRGAIDALLDTGTLKVRALVTHLGLKFSERRRQVRMLRKEAVADEPADARILMGDMNEWISSHLMRRAFTPEPFAVMITGRSFPSRRPWFPLDCIFAGPMPETYQGEVVRTPRTQLASDHLPVLAEFEWSPAGWVTSRS